MKQLEFEQFLPIGLADAWSFFSSPANLNLITPEKMQFKTISVVPPKMYEGLIIQYKIKPMMNIPMHWTTRILSVRENEMFIDEQIKGPYKTWLHEHHFEEVKGGVMMKDKLSYDIGFGIIGKLAGLLWVDKQVMEIFAYRKKKVEELFS